MSSLFESEFKFFACKLSMSPDKSSTLGILEATDSEIWGFSLLKRVKVRKL